MPSRARLAAMGVATLAALGVTAALTPTGNISPLDLPGSIGADPPPRDATLPDTGRRLTLAFAGDVHFAGDLSEVVGRSDSTLGPMSAALQQADLAMVNLESAITDESETAPKELEDPSIRYWFKTEPGALDVLDRSGVDVVSVANNHGADFGVDGVRDTLRAADNSPIAVVGVGRDDRQAFAPHRVRVNGTDIAVHAADASPREGVSPTWAAMPGGGPGIASARTANAPQLVEAVRESARVDDLVVVYLHWGEEGNACSTISQEGLARTLSSAGADIVVGTHAHTPLGAGFLGRAYVSYGLGNFYWYHGRESETGVLTLTVDGGQVVGDAWVPAQIEEAGGDPQPLGGDEAAEAVQQWQSLRACTNLVPGPGPEPRPSPSDADTDAETLPAFTSSVRSIGPSVRTSMTAHDDAVCPVPLSSLRHVTLSYVGFDGRSHEGELIVNADVADDVTEVFSSLYEARFPIARMRLVDDWAGDDDRSMAANNTSGYNCRRVAGTDRWSDHAYGRAVDINPIQNPYVVGNDVRPPAAVDFLDADRSGGTDAAPGVIVDGGAAREAFDDIGWEWGGLYPDADFQHFSTDG